MQIIMKYFILGIVALLYSSCSDSNTQTIVTSDIPLFWKAYDEVVQSKDSLEQIKLMDSLYFKNGSPGLHAINEARRYTAESYVDAINAYPQFWNSVRTKTLDADKYANEINVGIEKLRQIYPELKPANIYFTIGALRTGGTTLSDKVLIGTELALADSTTITSELNEDFPHLSPYFMSNDPNRSIVFTNIHEYVHTQQDTTIANSLMSKTLIEGVAEFVAELALNTVSPTESVVFGKNNDKWIKNAFVKEMFTEFEVMWFWGYANNQFNMGDLGYYVGYAISKSYYDHAEDKKQAIKEMIELDYLDEDVVVSFIDASGYFDKSIVEYKEQFQLNRPKVVGITEFANNSTEVDPSIKTMTIEFSKPMNTEIRNLRLGPLGEENLLSITDLIGWSEDHTKITFQIDLKKKLRQQLLVTDVFRAKDGYLLEPYLIDITTL